MKKKTTIDRNRTYALAIAAVLLILFSLVMSIFEKDSTVSDRGNALMHVIDVGQGDSILLQNGVYSVLVDAGPNTSEDRLIEYLHVLGVERLDCLVLTHPHEDHIGGADAVINEFDIDTILMPDRTSTSAAFERVLDAISERGLSITVPREGDTFSLGDLSFTVLAPRSEGFDDTNNYSIVLRVEHGDNVFLLTGDAEFESESAMLEHFDADLIKCNVLKIGHHGSSSSSEASFLDAADPEYAVISCADNNSYGHPHSEVLERLDERNITVLRTDKLGTIVFSSDGSSLIYNYN